MAARKSPVRLNGRRNGHASRKTNGSNGHIAAGAGATPLLMKAWSGYDAANWSPARGYVYFPTLDTARDLDDYTLYELRTKSRWIYVNVGFGTRCADGIANMVGSLTPVPQTDDRPWNQDALKSFTNNAGAELIFDLAGKFNFWSAQPMLTTNRLVDGDILGVLTESETNMARMMFYEAHQIGNADTTLDQSQWNTGVRLTPQNRALAYRILTDDGKKSVDIPAGDAVFHCQYRRPGRSRGEPAFRHAINHLLDRSEVIGFLKQSTKNAAQIGYQIVRSAPTFDPMPQLPPVGTGAGPLDSTLADGSTKVKVEDAYRGGKIPEMNPGEEIKMLLDQRPHPNQLEFLDYLVRDISWGLGCSSDILWNIAKLGGATARYVLADAQQTLIEPLQQLLADQFCSRFWIYYIAKEMKAGRLRQCQDPEWWKHGWQPQQKLTVDIGRDGRLYLDMHKAGMISLKRYFGSALGANWQPETDDYLDERQYIVQGVMARMIQLPDGTSRPMTMDEAFPPTAGVRNITERETPQIDPDDQPNDTVPSAPNIKTETIP